MSLTALVRAVAGRARESSDILGAAAGRDDPKAAQITYRALSEFQMHVGPLFFFNRDVSIAVDNSGFEHKHVETK